MNRPILSDEELREMFDLDSEPHKPTCENASGALIGVILWLVVAGGLVGVLAIGWHVWQYAKGVLW